MDDDTYESVLLVIKECMVYRIPPRATSRGYRASEWDVASFLWSGRLRVIAKGDACFINLEDSKTGELFAQCPYNLDGTSVESVLDSSRYFVLNIVDKASGKHAFVGMGFPERAWAFDFNVALQDHVKRVKNEREAAKKPKNTSASGPTVDYSLKNDQKIVINIGNMNSRKKEKSDEPASFGILPPPPSSSFSLPPPPPTAHSHHNHESISPNLNVSNPNLSDQQSSISSSSDPFASLASSTSTSTSASSDPFVAFGGSSNNGNNGSQQQESQDDDGWANFGDFVGSSTAPQNPSEWTTF
ncbi:hypothetical protein HDU76_000260 [Blyttiomyces sp. JEL0837]|nr:hypothetical protein HDU76_000260 [Blyttiomyces sp. JEL0837]